MTPQEKPLGYECKHALYFTARDGSSDDLLVIKEYAHFPNGKRVPHLRFVENYKRPFWITKEPYRNHNDKKEGEALNRLQEFKTTQAKLIPSIQRALGRAPSKTSLKMVARSPYVYGTDVTTPVLAKHEYQKRWPNCISDNAVAVLDAETDVVNGTEEILMLALTMRDRAKLVVVKEFLDGLIDPIAQIYDRFERYLGEIVKERNIKLEIDLVENAGECVQRILETAHKWQPDFVAIWNMNFDVPRMVKALERFGIDPADAFCDPRVPQRYRQFRYVEGPSQKVTSSGKVFPLHPAEQWHTAHFPASFYIIDAMCVYQKLRIAKGKDPSYSLDAILKKHKVGQKLKFSEADHLSGLQWHRFMQTQYKPEYCVYNIADCIMTELLDEKTTDLMRMISMMCGHSEYHRFPSQPRRTCDDLHFMFLEQGQVVGSTSDQLETELDARVVSLRDWIVTLPSYMVFHDGLKILEELPDEPSKFFKDVADLDLEGTYPNEQEMFNISRSTTVMELSQIEGIDEQTQRAIGVNLTGGYVNAVEICCTLYKAPTLDTLLRDFKATLEQEVETDYYEESLAFAAGEVIREDVDEDDD